MAKKNYKAGEPVKYNTADNLLLTEENIYGTLNTKDSIEGSIESSQINVNANIVSKNDTIINNLKEETQKKAYQVRVICSHLGKRNAPNGELIDFLFRDSCHLVVREKDGWGQLQDNSWIELRFTEPVQN